MIKTRWFGMHKTPHIAGWYEWKDCSAMRYWDGEKWLDSFMVHIPMEKIYSRAMWRGMKNGKHNM